MRYLGGVIHWSQLPEWVRYLIVAVIAAGLAHVLTRHAEWVRERLGRVWNGVLRLGPTTWRDRAFEKVYLNYLVAEHRDLKLVGVQTSNRPMLEEVFVSLRMVSDTGGRSARSDLTDHAGRSTRGRHTEGLGLKQVLPSVMRLVVLGAPGGGKTTLLQYIALSMSRERASDPRYKRKGILIENLGAMPWRLPVYIPLRRVPESGLGDLDAAVTLSPYLSAPSGYFQRQLRRGRCILLLDGLDEVGSEEAHERVARAIRDVSLPPFADNQVVVTCRIAGWRGLLPAEFRRVELAPLELDDMQRFLRSWYLAVDHAGVIGEESADEARRRRERSSERATELLNALRTRGRLRSLATNPLLLSIIAIVHRTRVVLPRQRTKLYRECTELLLEQWDQARGLTVDDTGLKLEVKLLLMRAIAYNLHDSGLVEASRQHVLAVIDRNLGADSFKSGNARLLRLLEERSGLITERSQDVMAFAHLTFQEYFVAQAIAMNPNKRSDLLEPSRLLHPMWREVVLLYVGQLDDGTEFIETILRGAEDDLFASRLRLAASCLNDAVVVDKALREEIIRRLVLLWHTSPFRSQREQVDEVIGFIDDEQLVTELIQHFRSQSPSEGRRLSSAFEQLRSARFHVPPDLDVDTSTLSLEEQLDGLRVARSRWSAEPESDAFLVRLMHSKHEEVRIAAATAVPELPRPSAAAIDALLRGTVSPDSRFRAACWSAIIELGVLTPAIEAHLLAALSLQPDEVRAHAARAAAALGCRNTAVVARLRDSLGSGGINLIVAIEALHLLGETDEIVRNRTTELLTGGIPVLTIRVIEAIAAGRAQYLYLERLLQLLAEGVPTVQLAALTALTSHWQEARAKPSHPPDMLPRLLGSEDDALRLQAACAHYFCGWLSPELRAVARECMDGRGSDILQARVRLASAIGAALRWEEEELDLLDTLVKDPMIEVRVATIEALGRRSQVEDRMVRWLHESLWDVARTRDEEAIVGEVAYQALYRLHLATGAWIPGRPGSSEIPS